MICQRCGKSPQMGYNRPHSLHKTKRIIKPNLQSFGGVIFCTRCLRTVRRNPQHVAP